MDKDEVLNDIFGDDSFGILDIKFKNPIITDDDRLIATFEEINLFYEKNNKEPQKTTNMNERSLYSRLDGIKKSSFKIKALKKYDKYNLLEEKTIEINSIDDIFAVTNHPH